MTPKAIVSQEAQKIGYGQHRIRCPLCSHERTKKHERTMSLQVEEDHFLFNCWHCNEEGAGRLEAVHSARSPRQRERSVSVARAMETTALDKETVAWLKDRGISKKTAEKAQCKQIDSHWIAALKKETRCIAFPYKNKGKVYAAKIRSVGDKGFSANGSPQTFFNAENVKDWKEIVIVEGEMDVLSFIEAGVDNVVSVPNGAISKELENEDDRRLRFIKNHADDLEKAERVILMLDSDGPGELMTEEIARRIGRDRCWTVPMPEGCKDANDVLMKHGKVALKDLLVKAEPWPIVGLYQADHFFDQVEDLYVNGVEKGAATGLPSLDRIYSITPGQLTVVTGFPGSGKSELVDQIMLTLACKKGWKSAICSFENEPHLHIAKLIQKFIGKPFFSETGYGRMSDAEKASGQQFVSENFSFLYNNDGNLTSLDSIMERARAAVLRSGVRVLVIDPYNYIAKPKDVSETEWVSTMLSRVRSFAQAHGVHVFFLAHPTKMPRSVDGTMAVPKGNDISGSAAWWAKADMGLTVHRPRPDEDFISEFHVWKVRHSWLGRIGTAEAAFDADSARYFEGGWSPQGQMARAIPF